MNKDEIIHYWLNYSEVDLYMEIIRTDGQII